MKSYVFALYMHDPTCGLVLAREIQGIMLECFNKITYLVTIYIIKLLLNYTDTSMTLC